MDGAIDGHPVERAVGGGVDVPQQRGGFRQGRQERLPVRVGQVGRELHVERVRRVERDSDASHRRAEAVTTIGRAIDRADIRLEQQRSHLRAARGAAHPDAESVSTGNLIEDGWITCGGKHAQARAVVLQAAVDDIERGQRYVAGGGVRALAARCDAVHQVRDDAAIQAVFEVRIAVGRREDVAAPEDAAVGSSVER